MRFFSGVLRSKQTCSPAPPQPTVRLGRTYLAGVPYLLPGDEQEKGRLNFQHHFLHELLHGQYLAPIPAETDALLDVGCGTGIWMRDMARLFPRAEVVGLDIKLPTCTLPPPANCRFVQGNVLDGLPFPAQHFAFTHQRLLVAAIPALHWPFVVSEMARVTRPGGFVELVEASDIFTNTGPATATLLGWWRLAARQTGFDASLMAHLDTMLLNAGLHGVVGRQLRVPLGRWAGRWGEGMAKDLHAVFVGLQGFLCSQLALPEEQYDQVTATLQHEWNSYQTHIDFYVAYGQKKREGETHEADTAHLA